MPKISVIIPVYNVEKYLEECLESVINQTFKDIEIICVNDGSTDNSGKILDEYAKQEKRIRVFYSKNKGAGFARNLGLIKAKGEYLAFLDSDDFYHPNYLDKMYNKAKLTNADIVVCAAKKFDTNTRLSEPIIESLRIDYLPKKEVFSYKDMPKYIFNFSQNWNWNKLFRRKFIKKNHIHFQNIYRTNDLYFTDCALILADKITTINEPLVNYRIGMEYNCQSTNHLYPLDFYKAFKSLRKFLIKKGIYEEVRSSYVMKANRACIYNLQTIKHEATQIKLSKQIDKFGNRDLDLNFVNKKIENTFIKYINDFKNKHIVFWGASCFLEKFLNKNKNKIKNNTILGIIDKNNIRQGEHIKGYKIFTPESLTELKPDVVIMTIQNNNELIYKDVKKYLQENYPKIELLPNIFNKEIIDK